MQDKYQWFKNPDTVTKIVAAVLLLALQAWIGVDYFTLGKEFVFSWTAILPIFAFICEVLAIRGIYADELLVKNASRLRAAKRKK